MNRIGKFLLVALFVATAVLTAQAQEVKSVSRIAFGPADTLFLADWQGGRIHAFKLPAAGPAEGKPFNLVDVEPALRSILTAQDFELEDFAVRPDSSEAYIAVEAGAEKKPAVVMVTADGRMTKLDLQKLEISSFELRDQPDKSLILWDKIPGRSFTVTDMQWYDGKLYVAGLSNQAFSSTLRIIPYPFQGSGQMLSVAMYHTVHNQIETRAPIRAMTFAQIGGKPYLLAAYLCTPLVSIPVEDLKDGAHVQAKTIAELGESGIPVDLITYQTQDQMTHKMASYALAVNLFSAAQSIPFGEIEAANGRPGLSTPVMPYGAPGPLKMTTIPFDSVVRAVNLDDKFLLALRRDPTTGHTQIVTYDKGAMFRLSDFDESEFLLPGYEYTAPFQRNMIRPMQNMLKVEEGFPNKVRN